MHQEQDAVLAALQSPDAYPHATEDIERIETHISWIYLTGPFAYKVKKDVSLPYVDFSSLERRREACNDELTLNRRLAPALYHEVVGIGGEGSRFRIGGTPTVEYAVKMTQFPVRDTTDHLIENDALSDSDLVGLAQKLAAFHESLPPLSADAPAERIASNFRELESQAPDETVEALQAVGRWLRPTLERLAPAFADRDTEGRIRECHGDLHLGNIVRLDGELVPFDCLEFSLALRTIDVIDEVAFLCMDLLASGREDLAFAFLNAWLEISGDYFGLRLLRLYIAHRALVRAKVEAASPKDGAKRDEAQFDSPYLETALAQSVASEKICVITCGLSGSGKTTVARRLARQLGAVHLRSDVERKRLHGLASGDASRSGLDRGIYAPASSERTYRHLFSAAEAALETNINVVIDASFLHARQRMQARETASRLDAQFLILHCEAREDVLRRRIRDRGETGHDASEADLEVLEHQLETMDSIGDEEADFTFTLDTEREHEPASLAREIRDRCTQVSLSSTSY